MSGYYHPPKNAKPPGKVEIKLEIDNIWLVENWIAGLEGDSVGDWACE